MAITLTNREFDFVSIDGLRKITGRPAHEWDVYIIKELVDNALDAEESRRTDLSKPTIEINVNAIYKTDRKMGTRQVEILVSSKAPFPFAQLPELFSPRTYCTDKHLPRRLTRGFLGNALKTILGIPYALHNVWQDDWQPYLRPVTITTDTERHSLYFDVDAQAKTVNFNHEIEPYKPKIHTNSTIVSVNLDFFLQEEPRTFAELEWLAELFSLSNPHVTFSWKSTFDANEWNRTFEATEDWQGKVTGPIPSYWYPNKDFCSLINLAKQHPEPNSLFPDLTQAEVSKLIESDYRQPSKLRSQQTSNSEPGSIGKKHCVRVFNEHCLPDTVFYKKSSFIVEAKNAPVVFECCLGRLKEGERRLACSINFTPAYGDPFIRRFLVVPEQSFKRVQGLNGLLDAYELDNEHPLLLFIHLVSPYIEHCDFSKTEIEHMPFRDEMCLVIEELVKAYKDRLSAREKQLQLTLDADIIPSIVARLSPGERLDTEHVVEFVTKEISKNSELAGMLEDSKELQRLIEIVKKYVSTNDEISQYIISDKPRVTLPIHPGSTNTITMDFITGELLKEHFVDKAIVTPTKCIEKVIVENGWLSTFDAALINLDRTTWQHAIQMWFLSCELPLVLLRSNDEESIGFARTVIAICKKLKIPHNRVVDLGDDLTSQLRRLERLISLLPSELKDWFKESLVERNIEIKAIPNDEEMHGMVDDYINSLSASIVWDRTNSVYNLQAASRSIAQDLKDNCNGKSIREMAIAATNRSITGDSFLMCLQRVLDEEVASILSVNGHSVEEIVKRTFTKRNAKA